MILIGLSGMKQSGKSTVANYMRTRKGFTELSFAYPLKEIIGKQLFGLNDSQLYGSDEDKERVITDWHRSPRQILQIVGTDLFRNNFDSDFWVKLCLRRIREIRKNNAKARIVVSDCRFFNEQQALKDMGAYSFNIIKDGQVSQDHHESEHGLDRYPFDYQIKAKPGKLNDLYGQVDEIINGLWED